MSWFTDFVSSWFKAPDIGEVTIDDLKDYDGLVARDPFRQALQADQERAAKARGFSSDESVDDLYGDYQDFEQQLVEQANIANKDYFDYTFEKSENAAQNAYNRSLDYVREYYPALMESIRAAGLEPNLVLSGGASVSAPSIMASGSALSQQRASNILAELLELNMTNSNKALNTSIRSLSNVASALIKVLG